MRSFATMSRIKISILAWRFNLLFIGLNPEDLQKEEIYKFHSKKFIQNTFES
jgi:hypothetical protein